MLQGVTQRDWKARPGHQSVDIRRQRTTLRSLARRQRVHVAVVGWVHYWNARVQPLWNTLRTTYFPHFLPERDYVTFGYSLSQIRLSVVGNVRAPYSAGWNFRQCFYAILYLTHPPNSTQTFTEIVPGEPLRRGLNPRGVAKYSDFGSLECYISKTVQDTASGTINDQ